jgi:hypothetical protein
MTLTQNQERIATLLTEVFESKGLTAPVFDPGTVLDQIGLESLDFAQVVIRMEELTGKDPFASGEDLQIKLLSEFAALYDEPVTV